MIFFFNFLLFINGDYLQQNEILIRVVQSAVRLFLHNPMKTKWWNSCDYSIFHVCCIEAVNNQTSIDGIRCSSERGFINSQKKLHFYLCTKKNKYISTILFHRGCVSRGFCATISHLHFKSIWILSFYELETTTSEQKLIIDSMTSLFIYISNTKKKEKEKKRTKEPT